MATKRVTINKSDGTSNSFDFTIPETAGTYNIKFTLGSTVIDAGNITVNDNVNTYRLSFGLSNGTTIDAGTFTTPIVEVPVLDVNYVTFSSPSSFSITPDDLQSPVFEYSTDGISWIQYVGDPMNSSSDGKLYLRGIGNSGFGNNIETAQIAYMWYISGDDDITISGNIENLLDYETVANGGHPGMDSYCFGGIFGSGFVTPGGTGRHLFVDICVPPILTSYCLALMFYSAGVTQEIDCTNVIEIYEGALYKMCDSMTFHFGPALTFVDPKPFGDSNATMYMHFTESDEVLFTPANLITTGTSKNTRTYTVYTDNSIIKDGVLSKADSYTTVNVYKLDGGAWA